MQTSLVLLSLGGAVALLLWGVHMVRSGVQRALGAQLRRILARGLHNRMGALLAGLGVTAVLQSSTAVGLMIASFAAAGLVSLGPALAVMLGANIGTTLIVQALSFDVTRAAPALLIVGVFMFRAGGARARDLGRAAIGLGLMLLALARLLEIVTPFETAPGLRVLLDAIAADRLVSVLFGMLVAWAAHSSVAVVLLVMSFVSKGVVPLDAGLALIVGANVGTALNPLLESARSGAIEGRRVALGNLGTRLAAALVALPLLPSLAHGLHALENDPARAAANFHTAFNLAAALAFLPALTPYARWLERLLPAPAHAADATAPLYLDPAALATPSVALGHATREALRMVDALDAMLQGVGEAMKTTDRDALARARRLDDVLDALNRAVRGYLARLDADGLGDDEHRRVEAILAFVFNLESAGDVIERNIGASLAKRFKREPALSDAARAPLDEALDAVRGNLRLAASVFTTGDAGAARDLADQKAAFRQREAQTRKRQIERLRDGAAMSDAAALDLMRDLKRVNGYLVAAAAYPVLEAAGALAESRLLEHDESVA
jgi:phosphate:Na+ symporter